MADFNDFEKKFEYTASGSENQSGSQSENDKDYTGGERSYQNNYEGGYRSYGNRQGGYNRNTGNRQGGYNNGYRQGGYQSRYNRQRNYDADQHGEQSTQHYGQNYYGERSYRPRYNNNGEGGYRPHYNKDGGQSYRPRYNSHQDEEGGYRSRFIKGGYHQGGYNNGGYRQGGFNRGAAGRGGYQQRGGFNNRYNPKRRTAFPENVADPNAPLRLNKFLANAGVCSRRDADKYIQAGVVKVNGQVVTELGTKVLRSDEVVFHDQLIKPELKVYVLLNKPKGYVTTSEDPENRKTVMDLVKGACPERIYPVGRLDRNTTGVLLLTNDGEMASKLTHPKYLKKKIYHVWLDKNLKQEDAQRISDGITLEDGDIRADDIQYVRADDRKQVGIEIHSGRNRIVRRMFEALGYHVIKLDRVFFAGLTKKNLKRGAWRFLSEQEVNFLRMGAFE